MFGSSESADAASGGGSGMVGKVLSGLIMLLLGAILGVGAYSFLVPKPTPEPNPPVLQTQAVDLRLTSFEKLRREVDSDPVKFISASATTPPHDGEDYYLLGRAYLLTGDHAKARAAFMEARNRVGEINDINRKPILYEIAMAMAILNNTFTQRALADDLSTSGLSSNSNTNTGANGNANR
jgi:hypothetical protein